MADLDYDSALPVRGNVLDGDSGYAENTILVTAGHDTVSDKYFQINVDGAGRTEIVGAGADGDAIVGFPAIVGGLFETDGGSAVDTGDATRLALDAYGRVICVGQVADGANAIANAFPVVVAGIDTDGKVESLLTDSSGRLIVNVGGGTKSGIVFNSTNLVKDTPTSVVSLAGGANGQNVSKLYASGSGLCKFELMYGTTASEDVIGVQFNSTANPNVVWDFTADNLNVATGNTVKIRATNLENRASPASDYTGYGTIVTEVPV